MKEILGGNLKLFFDLMDKNCDSADITYAGNRYEVWKVSDELFTGYVRKAHSFRCGMDSIFIL